MGQVLSAITGPEKKPTSQNREYTPSFSYNVRQTTPAANFQEKKEIPRRTTSQRSFSVRELDNLESFLARLSTSQSKAFQVEKQASRVKENTISHHNRLYSTVTSPERKTTRVIENATSISYLPAKKTVSGVKENTTSFPYATTKKTTTSEVKGNSTFIFDNSIRSMSERELTSTNREDIKKITEIVRHLLRNNYVVYGNWACRHWPLACDNEDEWQYQLTQRSLQRYLTLSSENKYDFFVRLCEGCHKESLITSFFLYKQKPISSNKKPTVEIICHLEWNNHYRVFAGWRCQRPQINQQHEWKSSYTWISLQKFIEKASAGNLGQTDYYTQKCYECRENCNVCKNKPKEKRGCWKCDYEGVVTTYDCLELSAGGKPHKRWLCAKCKGGSTCVRADYNHRARRNRKIELF